MHAGVDLIGKNMNGDTIGRKIGDKGDLVVINTVLTESADGNIPMIPHTTKETIIAAAEAAGIATTRMQELKFVL